MILFNLWLASLARSLSWFNDRSWFFIIMLIMHALCSLAQNKGKSTPRQAIFSATIYYDVVLSFNFCYPQFLFSFCVDFNQASLIFQSQVNTKIDH